MLSEYAILITSLIFNREYTVDPLMSLRVGEVMDNDPPTIPATMKLSDFSDRLAQKDRRLSRRQGTLIVDEEGRLIGIITRGDVLRAIEENSNSNLSVIEAGSRNLIVTYPDEILYEAIDKMVRNDIGRLPVVNRLQNSLTEPKIGRIGGHAPRVVLNSGR